VGLCKQPIAFCASSQSYDGIKIFYLDTWGKIFHLPERKVLRGRKKQKMILTYKKLNIFISYGVSTFFMGFSQLYKPQKLANLDIWPFQIQFFFYPPF
jgi:hypothetical protein